MNRKTSVTLLVAIMVSVRGFAQNEVGFSRIEMAVGYGNLSLPSSLECQLGVGNRGHSGFGVQHTFKLDSVFAVENYFGYYSLGRSSLSGKRHLVTDMLGGRISLPKTARVVPYVSAGLRGATTRAHPYDPPNFQTRTDSGISIKIGGGDIRFNDRLAWKVDVSRMSFHFGHWYSGVNPMTGIACKWSP
jgi:hypothetical protein